MAGTVEYTFNNEQDFAFYILNAVGHDFIHDFNNYERMNKILYYIQALIKPSGEGTPLGAAAASPPASEDEDEDEEEPGGAAAIGGGSFYRTMQKGGEDNTGPIEDDTIDELLVEEYKNYGNIPYSTIVSEYTDKVNESIGVLNGYMDTLQQRHQTRTVTRSISEVAHILQQLDNFINELKLVIIGTININITRVAHERRADVISSIKYGGSRTQRGGFPYGKAIDIITKEDILISIKTISEEINPELASLKNLFTYIMYIYDYLTIPGISPLEIFSNSIINDATSIFIIGQCQSEGIYEQAEICLTQLVPHEERIAETPIKTSAFEGTPIKLRKIQMNTPELRIPTPYKSRKISSMSPTTPIRTLGGRNKKNTGGGKITPALFRDINGDRLREFRDSITQIKQTFLFDVCLGKEKLIMRSDDVADTVTATATELTDRIRLFYRIYELFRDSNADMISLIVGTKRFTSANNTIAGLWRNIQPYLIGGERRGRSKLDEYTQKLTDSINAVIFTETISEYEDFINREKAKAEVSGKKIPLPQVEREAVQRISILVAAKILTLTEVTLVSETTPSSADLNKQIEIIDSVSQGRAFTAADDALISYFVKKYNKTNVDLDSILTGREAYNIINDKLTKCDREKCRVVNNAIGDKRLKKMIEDKNIVTCPTSSVCDAMSSLGSCAPPGVRKEYFNMDFNISYGDRSNFYYGDTTLKSRNEVVHVNYGFKYNNLEIYNFMDIDIRKNPNVLSANNSFKNLINKIIEIWKTSTIPAESSIEDLWGLLYGTEYFLSVMKMGTQKAIGDIFQEINSTLANGGYAVPNPNVLGKTTYGLMGDRPSGIRIIKLLKDSQSGANPRAGGGYLGNPTSPYSIIYFLNSMLPSFVGKAPQERKPSATPYSRGKGGGRKYSTKIKRSKVTKKNKYVNRRRKTRVKRNKTRKDKSTR